jgi:redox-regulated HSP33 family molecular chaperone
MKYCFLLIAWLLSGCALERDMPAATAGALDSTLRIAELSTGKVKFNGLVTLQIGGAGNVATTTAIAKAKAPVASAPHATATESTTKAGPPWWVYAGGGALLLVAGWLLRGRWSL